MNARVVGAVGRLGWWYRGVLGSMRGVVSVSQSRFIMARHVGRRCANAPG